MQRYQIYLGDRPLRQNKLFLRAMYNSQELEEASRWFDKKNYPPLARQPDKEMTLDSYLRLMTPSFHVILQTGSPDFDKIRCCARGSDKQGIERFLWIISPFTDRNYGIVSEIFKRIYKQELGLIGVVFHSKD